MLFARIICFNFIKESMIPSKIANELSDTFKNQRKYDTVEFESFEEIWNREKPVDNHKSISDLKLTIHTKKDNFFLSNNTLSMLRKISNNIIQYKSFVLPPILRFFV